MSDISMIPRPGPEQVPVLQPMPQRNETSEGDRPPRKVDLGGSAGAIANDVGSFASAIGMDSQSTTELVTEVRDTLNAMQKEADGGKVSQDTVYEKIREIMMEKSIDADQFFKSMDFKAKDARALMLDRNLEDFVQDETAGEVDAKKVVVEVQSKIMEGLVKAETPEARKEIVHDAIRNTLDKNGLDSEKFIKKLETDREANKSLAPYTSASDEAADTDDGGIRLIDIKT